MYKEVVVRNRVQVLFVIMIGIVVALYTEQAIDFTKYNTKHVFSYIDIGLISITSLFVIYEFITFKICYKYSLIADKLIVNRSIFHSEKNLVSIRKSDVIYIGKSKGSPKNIRAKCLGKYTCSLFSWDNSICIFKNGDKYYKFKFSPSEKLKIKLNIV